MPKIGKEMPINMTPRSNTAKPSALSPMTTLPRWPKAMLWVVAAQGRAVDDDLQERNPVYRWNGKI